MPTRHLLIAARCAAWLCGGAVLSIVVSWGVLWIPWGWHFEMLRAVGSGATTEVSVPWPHEPRAGWPETASRREWYHAPWFDFETVSTHREKTGGVTYQCEMTDLLYGVPFRGLRAWEVDPYNEHQEPTWKPQHGMIFVRPPLLGPMDLPVLVRWPGFALNTLFYAVIAWGLWQVPVHLRRRHRRAHNRCPRCGYSLAGLAAGAACPECGGVQMAKLPKGQIAK